MTAVEWIVEQYEQKIGKGISSVMADEIKQAKEMEKEQKIEFACDVYDKYNFGPQEISFREECEQFKSE